MRAIGFDLGSSFIKGAILDLEQLSLSHTIRLPFPDPIDLANPAFREFDPRQILQATRHLLEQLLALAPDAECVLMSSQLHGLVLTNARGQALGNAISWQDQRALLPLGDGVGTYFDEINRRLDPEDRRRTGNEVRPGVPLCFLFWLAQHHALPAEPAIPCSLAHFVAASLCGEIPKSELTHAFAHGALDVETGTWHQETIRKLGLESLQWPNLVPQESVIGRWNAGSKHLPWFAPTGDYHCSQVGALLEEEELSVNISTGSAVIQLAQGCEFGDFQTRPWFDGRFLKTITHIPGGRALTALVNLLGELPAAHGLSLPDPWDYILREAALVQSTILRMSPAFYFGAMGHEGSLSHIREEELRIGPLFHAAFAGMAENYEVCASRIAPRRDWSRVVFSGGVGLKIALLRTMICQRLGAAHRLAASDEDVLFGLLALGLRYTGRAPSVLAAMQQLRSASAAP
ncbi:MAG: hypothetical protein JNN07_23605 [Verrucomicrobiales bacterium]|nr:hypothetical protein [Verrucomicrobiales bacterium]